MAAEVQRSWGLLADLLQSGPEARRQDLMRVEALARHLPEAGDEAEAAFHHLFSVEVQPFASAVLEPSRCLGGELTQGLWDTMDEAGFHPDLEADHLATQLHFLAAAPHEVARSFLAEWLLPWLPPVVVAVNEVDPGLYGQALTLVHDLGAHQAAGLPVRERLAPAPTLEDPGLRDLAELLVTPTHAGFWLTHSSLGRLSQDLALPRGFGSRARVVETLLRSAVHRERLPELLARLQEHILATGTHLAALEGGSCWAARCEHTAGLLASLPTPSE